jgi:hypothetical protein
MFALLLFFLRLCLAIQVDWKRRTLRHQLTVLQRKVRGRVEFTNGDRLFFILLYQ